MAKTKNEKFDVLLEIFTIRVFVTFLNVLLMIVPVDWEDRIVLFLDALALSNAVVFAFIFMQCEQVITISKAYQNGG